MDSEAVECATEELSGTMYDPFGVVGLVYKRKVCIYIHSLVYVQLSFCAVFLKIHLKIASYVYSKNGVY